MPLIQGGGGGVGWVFVTQRSNLCLLCLPALPGGFFTTSSNLFVEKEVATHSSIFLPGEFHGQRSLVGYSQSLGSQRVGRN